MEGNCLVFLSEAEESDSLCLLEDGGGGRRGTWGAGLHSGRFSLLWEVPFVPSSRSREASRTTTPPTSASSVTCGAPSHTESE